MWLWMMGWASAQNAVVDQVGRAWLQRHLEEAWIHESRWAASVTTTWNDDQLVIRYRIRPDSEVPIAGVSIVDGVLGHLDEDGLRLAQRRVAMQSAIALETVSEDASLDAVREALSQHLAHAGVSHAR